MIAPGGTPRGAVDRLNGEMVKFINIAETRTRLLNMGMEPIGNTPDQMAAHLISEWVKWARIRVGCVVRHLVDIYLTS